MWRQFFWNIGTALKANPNHKTQCFGNLRLVPYRTFFLGNGKKAKDQKCSESFTEVSECDGVRVITLNNPKTCNALSMPMMESILNGLVHNWCDLSLRCIILKANGSVWSAGHDLKELAAASKSQQRAIFDKLTEIILNIQSAPVPVIASINGLAAAAGTQLVSSCDIVVASEKSKFSTPGAKFGVFCSTPGVALSRAMTSRSKAAYMLLTSLPITAKEAYEAGLVTRVVAEAELDNELSCITGAVKKQSRTVVAHGKCFFYDQLTIKDLKEVYAKASDVMVENLQMTDGKEGLQSFSEKRVPKWKHEE